MVNNQEWFNKEYPKETKKIELEDEKFSGQLVIENYSELEDLYLENVKNIDKIILRNLTRLQECAIWNCSTEDLIINNCPQIKKLNVRNNQLTNLDFVKPLRNLQELELDNNTKIDSGLEHFPTSLTKFSHENTKLVEILKPYQGDWKKWKYQKSIQELIKIAKQNPQELAEKFWNLQQENKELREQQTITIDNQIDFEKKYQRLKEKLNFLLKNEQKTKKIKPLDKNIIITDEIIEKIRNLQKSKNKLEKQLTFFNHSYQTTRKSIEEKERELSELKNVIIISNHLEEDDLEDILEAQIEFFKSNDSKRLIRTKRKLVKTITETEINNLCQLQTEIAQLKLESQESLNQQEKQINQTIINIQQGHLLIGNTLGDQANFSYHNQETKIEEVTEQLLSTYIEQLPKNKS